MLVITFVSNKLAILLSFTVSGIPSNCNKQSHENSKLAGRCNVDTCRSAVSHTGIAPLSSFPEHMSLLFGIIMVADD